MNAPEPVNAHARGFTPFAWRRVLRLACKELREIFRDRRTIITLVAMPLLLYPLMSVAFQQFLFSFSPDKHNQAGAEVTEMYRVGVLTSYEWTAFERRFDLGQKAWLAAQGIKKRPKSMPRLMGLVGELEASAGGQKPLTIMGTEEERATLRKEHQQWLSNGNLDLLIEIPTLKPLQLDELGPRNRDYPCEITFVSNSVVGREALRHVTAMFAAVNEKNLQERLRVISKNKLEEATRNTRLALATVVAENNPLTATAYTSYFLMPPNTEPPPINLIRLRPVPLVSNVNEGFLSLSALVPLILILMTITGAVYPAIDLTAGERERGTLEILVAAPIPRFELLCAKYATVVTVAILNAIVNLVCMAITLSWSGLAQHLFQEGGVSFVMMIEVFALLLLFAAFFSALLLCLTSFARSFKEAQAYLIPLMLAALAPGIMALMPGLKLQGLLMVLPLVNIVLLARDLFAGGMEPVAAGIVVFTTMLYALAALGLASRVFGAESVLYSEQSNWAELLRRPEQPQPAATLPAALWCLALMIPLQFTLHALLVLLLTENAVVNVLLGVTASALLFFALPALFIYLGHVEIHRGLGLRLPRPAAIAAGLLLGASLWPVQLYLLTFTDLESRLQGMNEVMKTLQAARESIGWVILIAVIVPAILEEFFFRGFFFQALKRQSGPLMTIGLSGLLFGVSHVVFGGMLGLERFVPSLILGLILGAVCWRTGSLWPSMIQHVCHNTISLVVGIFDPGSVREIPLQWLVGGIAGALVSVWLLWQWGEREASPEAA